MLLKRETKGIDCELIKINYEKGYKDNGFDGKDISDFHYETRQAILGDFLDTRPWDSLANNKTEYAG
jgi:hypothetical protein